MCFYGSLMKMGASGRFCSLAIANCTLVLSSVWYWLGRSPRRATKLRISSATIVQSRRCTPLVLLGSLNYKRMSISSINRCEQLTSKLGRHKRHPSMVVLNILDNFFLDVFRHFGICVAGWMAMRKAHLCLHDTAASIAEKH